MPLALRVLECGKCGLVICRDLNAAHNLNTDERSEIDARRERASVSKKRERDGRSLAKPRRGKSKCA